MQSTLIPRLRLALPGICIVLGMIASTAAADVITQWNFNVATGVNNTPAPSTGSGSATPVGMNGGNNNADILAATGTPPSVDPGSPNNGWRVRGSTSNGWSGTTQLLSGARWNASTAGYQDIFVSFQLHATDGSPRHAQLQYTTDGTNFTSLGALIDNNPTYDGFAQYTYDLSAIAAVEENANFGFKLVSAFSPDAFTNDNGPQAANTAFQRASAGSQVYNGTAGNWRFDMVTISGSAIPEPSSMAIGMMLAGLASVRRRKAIAR